MAPFNQTTKSILRIRAQAAAGKIDEAEAAKKIAALEKKGARYVARWTLPNGKEATKVCKSKREAERLEAENKVLARLGESTVPKYLRAKMREVFDFYLEKKMAGKASFSNARAHCRYACEVLGEISLERFDAHAEKIIDSYWKTLLRLHPESFKSQASRFNHRTYVHSAVAYWIKMRRLRIVNPYQILEVEKPDNVRRRAPSFEEYTRLLRVARGEKYPVWFAAHVVFGWEQGRRLSEHVSLRWEGVNLAPKAGDLPWVRIRALKQGGKREVWNEIPLTFEAASALAELKRRIGVAAGPVFANSPYILAYWNRMAMDEAGLKDLRFHDFRRAYRNRNASMDRELRKGLQGRKTDEMDDRYHTEERKALEAAVAGTYLGDFREMIAEGGEKW